MTIQTDVNLPLSYRQICDAGRWPVGGRSTQSGNNATVAFTIAHGLTSTPTMWGVTPRVALAAPNFIVSADGTNLTLTYATAPPNVASNVDVQWWACI